MTIYVTNQTIDNNYDISISWIRAHTREDMWMREKERERETRNGKVR